MNKTRRILAFFAELKLLYTLSFKASIGRMYTQKAAILRPDAEDSREKCGNLEDICYKELISPKMPYY